MEEKKSAIPPGVEPHPPYTQVYAGLVILLGLSLLSPALLPLSLAIAVIFLTAILKAGLIIANFMHLRYEPRLIWLAVGVVLFVFLMFTFGVYPDIPPIVRELYPS
jgi:caa(3)-type oxidase subunit IV